MRLVAAALNVPASATATNMLMSSRLVVLRMRNHSSPALIIALRSSIWDKREFAIPEIHGNLETLGTAQQKPVSVNVLFDLTPESSIISGQTQFRPAPRHKPAQVQRSGYALRRLHLGAGSQGHPS